MTPTASPSTRRLQIVRVQDRENLWFLGDLIQPIITTEMTDGRFMMALTHSKAGSEPPLHEHDGEDEIFYILTGTIEFWSGDGHAVLGPGDCILMPKDVPHIFRVSPDAEATWLVMSAPGGLDDFFRAVSVPAGYPGPQQDWQMDEETEARLEAACRQFGITLIGPPGTLPGMADL
ncbi:cupin domain-containing protein [Arthrobacter sp.]|uniref:cupin domain-containing protein n=1 Tax=Arthrobacter sp. TaxID=1667 RepID=UPI003A8CE008